MTRGACAGVIAAPGTLVRKGWLTAATWEGSTSHTTPRDAARLVHKAERSMTFFAKQRRSKQLTSPQAKQTNQRARKRASAEQRPV